MLANYINISLRNLRNHPFYGAINIIGLGIGFAAVFFIFLFVADELSFDHHQAKLEHLYRLNFFGKLGDQEAFSSATPGPAGPLFEKSFPEVEAACRIKTTGVFSVKHIDQAYREQHILYADSSFFNLFTARVMAGDARHTLGSPGQMVINASTAKKYFGSGEPIGQTLILDNNKAYRVGAVIQDYPENSHMKFDILLPMIDYQDSYIENWGSTNYHTYFLIKPGSSVERLSSKMNELFVEKFKEVLKLYLNSSWEEFTRQGNYARVELFPVEKIHLYSDLDEEIRNNGKISQVYVFSLVGLMILLLACINFVNLSTGRAAVRAKEVGVRKAIGAVRRNLAYQFLVESNLVCILAWVVALGVMLLLMPAFNSLSGKDIDFSRLFDPGVFFPMLLLIFLTGLLAGAYPAFYLAAFEPIKVLKGSFTSGAKKSALRNGLVVFQFFISVVLIISSLSVYQQVKYIQSRKLGFNKEQVMVISDTYLLGNNLESFKNSLHGLPQVKNLSIGAFLPVSQNRNTTSIINGRVANAANTLLVNNWWTDRDFIKTMEIDVIEGRDFSKDIISDSTAVVVNETLAKILGSATEPVVGRIIGLPREEGQIKDYHVIGIVKDFNFLSLHHTIEPLVIFDGGTPDYMCIRLETSEVQSLVKTIKSYWDQMAPGNPFTYNFMDERYERLYQSETRMGNISFVFAVLAVFIALIGLLGLATFTLQQRIKEIGIRKVLGASARGIIGLMTSDFILLIGLAIVFACPLAWLLMNRWLHGFAYRTDLSIWLFIGAGVGTLFLALIVIGLQTFKAAVANPIQSLRTE